MNEDISCCRLSVDVNLIEDAKTYINKQNLKDKAKVFALLGNEVRLKIIHLFMQYERLCVCDLADILEMKQSPISQHLRKLKDAHLLENKREGMTIFYFINECKKSSLKRILDVK